MRRKDDGRFMLSDSRFAGQSGRDRNLRFENSVFRYGMLLLFACLFSGCQVGRSWFHMDSNSGMPFFGLDLLPRRETTLNIDPRRPERRQAPAEELEQIRPASEKRVQPVELPRLTEVLGGEDEDVSLTIDGPPAEFIR